MVVLRSPAEIRDWLVDGLEQAELESPGFTHPSIWETNGPCFILRLSNGQEFLVRVSEQKGATPP